MGAAPSWSPAPAVSVAMVPDAAPQACRAADSRLDGAVQGLRAWMSAQALRRESADAPERTAMVRDDPAAAVAGHVMAAYLDVAPLA